MRPCGRHWMRHTAIVPKGFIRCQVLESLGEKPMSGSEIMDEIEKRTDGRWKPSPGSIYPLLSWLQDNHYIKEVSAEETDMKRYTLTESGKALLKEQRRIREQFRREAKLFPPPFLGALWFRIPPEKTSDLRESMHRLISAFFELGSDLEEKFSEQALEDVRKVLDEAAGRIEEIDRKLRVQSHE